MRPAMWVHRWASFTIALLTCALGAVLIAAGTSATAGVTEASCAYVESGPSGARGNYLQIHQPGLRRAVTISRSGRNIAVSEDAKPVDCEGREATVDNIDRIFLLSDSTRRLRLDLRNGGLGPGASESGPGADIEVFLRVSEASGAQGAQLEVLAGRAPNTVAFGRAAGSEQLNLNARRERVDDVDVYIESVAYGQSILKSELGAGSNTIDGRGPGNLRPSRLSGRFVMSGDGSNRIFGPLGPNNMSTNSGPDLLVGGPQDDILYAGTGSDRLIGGRGDDRIINSGGPDRINAGPGDDEVLHTDRSADFIDCGPGSDTARAGKEDRVRDCETVTRD